MIITHVVTVNQPISGKFLSPQLTRSVSGRRGSIRIDSYKDLLIFDRVSCVYYYEEAQTSDDELFNDGG